MMGFIISLGFNIILRLGCFIIINTFVRIQFFFLLRWFLFIFFLFLVIFLLGNTRFFTLMRMTVLHTSKLYFLFNYELRRIFYLVGKWVYWYLKQLIRLMSTSKRSSFFMFLSLHIQFVFRKMNFFLL